VELLPEVAVVVQIMNTKLEALVDQVVVVLEALEAQPLA
jgi:hypothetical protein